MGVFGQLKLNLWKHVTIRKRQPITLLLEFLWPVAVVILIVNVRHLFPPEPKGDCIYKARALPSAGLLPFTQSFVCNLENKCGNVSSYEEIPSYEDAKMGPLVSKFYPLIQRPDVQSVLNELTTTMALASHVVDAMDRPAARQVLGKAILVGDLLKDPSAIESFLVDGLKKDSKAMRSLFSAQINVGQLLRLLPSVGVTKMVCRPELLGQVLELTDPSEAEAVSGALCSLLDSLSPAVVQKLISQVDVRGLVGKVTVLLTSLGSEDVAQLLTGVGDIVDAVQDIPILSSLAKAPINAQTGELAEYLQNALEFLGALKGLDIDLNFVGEMMDDIEYIVGPNEFVSHVKAVGKHVHRLINWSQTGVLQSPGSAQLTVASVLNDKQMFANYLRNKTSLSQSDVDVLMTVRVKPGVSGNRDFCYRLCQEMTVEKVIEFEGSVDMTTVVQLWTITCADKNCQAFIKEDFSQALAASSSSAMTVDAIAEELRDLLSHTSYLGNQVGGTLKKAFPAFDVLWKLTTTALSIAFLPEWDFNNSTFVNGLATTLETLPGYLPEQTQLPVLNLVTAADVAVTLAVIVAKKAAEVDHALYKNLLNDPKRLEKTLAFGPDVMASLAAVFLERSTLEMLMERPGQIKSLVCNASLTKALLAKASEDDAKALQEFLCDLPMSEMADSFASLGDREMLIKTVEGILLANDQEDVDTAFSSRVRSLCLHVWELVQVVRNSTKDGKKWERFLHRLDVDGQNLLETRWMAVRSKLEGVKYGSVLNLYTSVVGRSLDKKKFSGRAEKVMAQVGVTMNAITEEALSVPESFLRDLANYWPSVVHVFLESLGNPQKVRAVVSTRTWSGVVCNETLRGERLAIPTHLDHAEFTEFFCNLTNFVETDVFGVNWFDKPFVKTIQTLADGKTRPGSQKTKISWTESLEDLKTMLSRYGSFVARSLDHEEEANRLAERTKTVFSQLNVTSVLKFGLNVGTVLLEFADRQLTTVQPWIWKHIKALISAVDMLVQHANKELNKILDENKVETGVMTFNLPILTTLMRKVIRLFPDFMHVFADLLTKRLGDLVGRIFQVVRASPTPCDGLSVTDLVDFSPTGNRLVRDMERYACEQWKFMLSEVIQYPLMFKLIWKFREATRDQDLFVNWTLTTDNAQLLVDQADELTRFTGEIFPDVEGFSVEKADVAIDRFVNAVVLNTTERGLRFLLLIGDALIPLFENVLKTGQLTNESNVATLLQSIHNESFDKEQLGEVAWFTFKTVMKTVDVVLSDSVRFFSGFKSDNVTLSSIFGPITLTGVFEAFPDYVNSLVHSVLRPDLPEILDELRINGSLSFGNLCEKPDVLERLVVTPDYLRDVNRTIVLDTACRLLSQPFHYFALEPYIYSWAIKTFDKVVMLWREQNPRNTIVHFVDIIDGIEFMSLHVRDIVGNATGTARYFQDLVDGGRWEVVGRGLLEAVVNAQLQSWTDFRNADLSAIGSVGLGSSGPFAQLLRMANATMAAASEGLRTIDRPGSEVAIRDLLAGHPELRGFAVFLEDHFMDVLQALANTLVFEPQKLKPLLKSPDWQNAICSSPPSEFFSSKTVNPALMEALKEEFCAIDLDAVLSNATLANANDLASISETLVSFVQRLAKFRLRFPESRIVSPLLGPSIWEAAVGEIRLEPGHESSPGDGHTQTVTKRIFENLLKLDDEEASVSNALRSMDTFVSANLKTVEFMRMAINESVWKTLRSWYRGKPRVQTLINVIEDIPNMTSSIVQTFLEPVKFRVLLEKLATLATGSTTLDEFCQDLHLEQYFHVSGSTASFSDLQSFVCTTDWKQFASDVIPSPSSPSGDAAGAEFAASSFSDKVSELYENVVNVSDVGLPYVSANYTDLPWINEGAWKRVVAAIDLFKEKISNRSQLIETSIQYVSLVDLVPDWSRAEGFLQLVDLQLDVVLRQLNVTKDPVNDGRQRKLYDIVTDVSLLNEAVDQIHVGVKMASDVAVHHAFVRQLKYFETFPNATSHFCSLPPADLDLSSLEKDLQGGVNLEKLFAGFCERPPSQWIRIMTDEFSVSKRNVKSVVDKIMLVLPAASPWFTDPRWRRPIRFDWSTFSRSVHFLDDLCHDPPADFYPGFLWAAWNPAFKAFGEVLPKMIALSGETVCPTMPRLNYAPFTGLVEVVHKQVLLAEEFERLLCDFPRMNLSSIYHRLKNDLDLVETLRQLRVHVTAVSLERIQEPSGESVTCPPMFNATSRLSGSLNELVVDYVESETRIQKIKDCFQEDTQAEVISEIDKYLKLMSKAMPLLNIPNITAITDSSDLIPLVVTLLNYVKEQVPVYVPTRSVLKSNAALSGNSSADPVLMSLVDGSININRLFTTRFDRKRIAEIFCDSGKLAKFTLPPIGVSVEPIVRELSQTLCEDGDEEAGLRSAATFLEAVDEVNVRTVLPSLQMQNLLSWNVVMAVGRRIGSLSSSLIDIKGSLGDLDFDSLTSNVTMRRIVEMLVPMVYAENLTALANGLDAVTEDLMPLIYGSSFEEELQQLAGGVHSVYRFVDTALRNHTIPIRDVIIDNGKVEAFLSSQGVQPDMVEATMNLTLNVSVLLFDKKLTKLENLLCNVGTMELVFDLFNDWGKITKALGDALCGTDRSAASRVIDIMFENINIEGIIKHDIKFVIAGIATKAGVGLDDAVRAVSSLLGAREFFPLLVEELKSLQMDRTLINMLKTLDPEKLAKGEISGSLISVTGNMVCGHPIRSFDEYFRLLQSASEKPPEAKDKIELSALPTKFCQTLYQQIAYRPAGLVIWGFVKPLLKGKILFTPDNPASRKIMAEANRTFDGLAAGIEMITKWSLGFSRLGDFANDKLALMEDVLSLPLVKSVVVGLLGPQASGSLFNLSSTLEDMGNPQRFLGAATALGEGLQCFETNRIIGYESEADLERAAKGFHKQGIFMAGIVFSNLPKEDRSRRDVAGISLDGDNVTDWNLPVHIRYKIRMDIDDVPTTKMIKARFWKPSPEDNFIEHLRYLRGFVEMQDMVDHAIIRTQLRGRQEVELPGMHLQQFPYPCYLSDDFGYLLRYNLPAVIALAWIFLIAFFVRELVLDREVMLEQIMRVMGMRAWVSWLSWFLKCLFVMFVTNVACVVILKYGGIFPNSDILVLFVFFFVFAVATIMFCYLVSIWFKTATVAAITAVLLYLTTYSAFVIITTLETRLGFLPKLLMNLLMATSFSQGCIYINRFEVQNQGINWSNMWQSPIPGDEMNFAWCTVMMAVDTVLYFLLATYFGAVIHAFQRSDRKRFRYVFWPFLPNSPHHSGKRHQLISESDSFANLNSNMKDGSLPVNDSKMANGNGPCKIGISLQNLRKVYHAGDSDEKVAVEGLCLDFYEGQITSMLGQNGAGKTTTINMLTGQFPPHSGWATIYGRDVVYEFDEIRKNLGICPQYNVLFDLLTVREHLEFYARLKGILSSKRIQEDVNAMLSSMGLEERQHETAEKLSGGMRRRLCVAIAFVGGSQTIILDEPTSGVDPVARRHIWNLIMKYKQGRTILLTTHNLDEADILSDRVAIIHEGKLLCCGSPLKLKRSFGSGYQLTISKTSPDFGSDTDSGAISTSSGSDSQTNCNALNIFSFIRSYVGNVHLVEDQGNEMVFCLPYCGDDGSLHTLDQFFLDLEKHQMRLGIGSYGLSCTTLEEVFMNVCLQAEANLPITPQGHKIMMMAKKMQMTNKGIIAKDTIVKETLAEPMMTSVSNVLKKQDSLVGMDAWLNKSLYHVHYLHLTGLSLKWSQFKWLVVKRFHHFRRDWRALLTCIFLPCVFVAIAMGLTLIRPAVDPTSPALKLDPSIYGPHGNSFFVSDENGGFYAENLVGPPGVGTACLSDDPDYDEMDGPCIYSNGKGPPPLPDAVFVQKERCVCTSPDSKTCNGSFLDFNMLRYVSNGTDVLYNVSRGQVSRWLIATDEDFLERRYGGWSFGVRRRPNSLPGTDDNVIAWYNNKGYHALPSYLNSLNNVLLRTSVRTNDSNSFARYGISTYSHPLHLSKTQLGMDSLLHHVSDVGIALVFLISFSFIPAGFVIYLVKERVQEEKRLQYVSGVGPLLYWSASLFSDMLILCVPVCLSAIIITIFDLPIYMYGHNFAATLAMLFMFGWATTPLMYIAEKFFDEPSLASMILFCANIFIGINTTVCTLLLYLFQKNETMAAAMGVLRYLFLVFPQYAFAGGLIDMTKNYIQAEVFIRFGDDTYINPFSMQLMGVNFIVLAAQGAFFFLVNLLLEYMPQYTVWIERRQNKFPKDFPSEDSDVQQERRKVLNGESTGDLMRLGNLYKVYNGMAGKTVAVDRICLSIPKGECFGLLGINGAGKTTIFRMLTGEIGPTFGEVRFKNQSISSAVSHGSQNIGYCPQANAVDELLTAEELLSFYAGLRGVPSVDIPLAVYKAVVQFNLQAHARNITKTYSCGTKRKLCAAVSVMGNPDIVLMDEPTSGMDPSTRRLVWNNVRQITKEKRSVILTSHSMEECDTLCNRLAIMVSGRFQCLGSPQYLKHKFGDGYTITLRIRDQPIDWKEILVFIQTNFPGSVLRAKHCSTIEFLVSRSGCSLGDVFSQLESAKESMAIEDFSVTQTSLDQVFVNFVQEQTDGPLRDFNGGHLNLGYSLDDDDAESGGGSTNGKLPQEDNRVLNGSDYQVTQF